MGIKFRIPAIYIVMWFLLTAGLSSAADNVKNMCGVGECSVEISARAFAECWIEGDDQIISYIHPVDGGRHTIPNACRRSNIFGGAGFLVAYPSTGGLVFLKGPSAVDLQHLGLPNTHDTARSADEDDTIATRMVQLGAQWWPSWDLYFRHSTRIAGGFLFYDYHFPSKVDVAFPETGGVWVSNFTQDHPRYEGEIEDMPCEAWLPRPPPLWNVKMRYALKMDDKAAMMKDLGATFYDSVDEVTDLAKTIEEAVGLFEPFRQRLRNMEDGTYRDRFCTDEKTDAGVNAQRVNEDATRERWGIMSFFQGLL